MYDTFLHPKKKKKMLFLLFYIFVAFILFVHPSKHISFESQPSFLFLFIIFLVKFHVLRDYRVLLASTAFKM